MVDRDILMDELCSHYDYIGRYIRIMGVDKSSAEDILNDVCEEAVKSIKKGKGPDYGDMRSWLRGIAGNLIKKYFRKLYRHKDLFVMAESELSDMNHLENVKDDKTVESVLLEAERRRMIGALLDTLPEMSRRVVVMHTWGRHTFAEVADILGINLNTAKSLFYRSCELMKNNYYKMTGEGEYYD